MVSYSSNSSSNGRLGVNGCFGLVAIGIICLACGVCVIGWMTGGFQYADGFREGHVQKFSRKGIIWTTSEGEMALPGLRTVGAGDTQRITNTWEFSVADPELAKQIEGLHQSQLVRLHYRQYLCSPPWRGGTGYFVTKVEVIGKE